MLYVLCQPRQIFIRISEYWAVLLHLVRRSLRCVPGHYSRYKNMNVLNIPIFGFDQPLL